MKQLLLMDNQIDWDLNAADLLAASCDEKSVDDLWLHQVISELHTALSTHPQFIQARQIALNHPPLSDSQSHWLPLLETSKVRIGLLSLYRFTRIPLHDHPGTFGAQRVLSGRIHLRQYHLAPGSDSDERMVNLIKDTDQVLGMAESAIPSWGLQIFGGAKLFADPDDARVFQRAVTHIRQAIEASKSAC